MIAKTLTFVTELLNQELKMTFGFNDNRVVASSLVNPDGSMPSNAENKIVVSVINLEHETAIKSMSNYVTDGGKGYGKIAPPVHLNLYLLVSANYDSNNYIEANKILSAIIGVFQANPYFNKQTNPDMKPPLEKLTFEIFNLPINELSHIWSGIGAKYVPSIIYKVRMLTIQEEVIKKEIPGIESLSGNTKPNS
ncbi:MAG: DUF4255 domain-containing protein [Flavobacteriaceae bacterium]|nr:DUF4255 domain-containing protein [Flavobacteriaceae bacterium]